MKEFYTNNKTLVIVSIVLLLLAIVGVVLFLVWRAKQLKAEAEKPTT